MNTALGGRVAYLRERAETSIWLIPLALCLASAVLAALALWADRHPLLAALAPGRFALPVASARQLLGVVAGSIIGVGGVAFSVTMVALTLTSGQYGPRIIRHFLEDSVSKISLGLFLGTYIYALAVSAAIGADDVPRFSVLGALALALAALAGFVAFVHRTATDLQADRIIERIGSQLRAALEQLAGDSAAPARSTDTLPWRRAARGQPSREVSARQHGYVQTIDYAALARWCAAHDRRVAARVRAGDFVIDGTVVLKIYGESADDDRLPPPEVIVTGPMRTPVQDPEFAITQLVQLAARALSPGINDPGTAITCIDWFSLALSRIVDRDLPGSIVCDADGTPRVLARSTDFAGIIKAGYAQLRQLADGDVAVIVALLESLNRLAALTTRGERLREIAAHGRLIHEAAARRALPRYDELDIRRRYRKLCALTDGCA